jgi:zinc D-Ala-D-Ala carboxypeptidase
MKNLIARYVNHKELFVTIGILFLIIGLGVVSILFYLGINLSGLRSETASSTAILSSRVSELETTLAVIVSMSEELSNKLAEEQEKRSQFEENLSDIEGTVGTLEKLSKTDKELLQKYSRVYFLSDNYVPMSLDDIDSDYIYDPKKDLEFHASALPFLERMLSRAERDGIDLKIVSAYRSFGTQAILKNGYLVTYGSGSNQFSADQGYSEHQLGTAVDITEEGSSALLTLAFENTSAFEWLKNNAYKYGFVLSYPKGNVYYQYEPWHWRFVGVKLATKLHRDSINFSDMEQREIDTYLVRIFD